MKKHLLQFIFIGMILVVANIASAINPVELFPKTPPPPPDTVQVTISLGQFSCNSLQCCYFKVYTTGPNGSEIILGWTLYNSWSTYTTPWYTITLANTKLICVTWHCTSACSPVLPDKTCCTPYTGSGQYYITCNPCN